MATFPTYPATSLEQAVDLTIFASNQIGSVVNGDAQSTVATENGDIPTLRKALIDNFYFKTPIDWKSGTNETVFNQLRYFANGILSGYYYAPRATTANPIPMGASPSGDSNWVLYQLEQKELPSEVHAWYFDGATGDETVITPPYVFDSAIVTIGGIIQIPGESYRIEDSKIILGEPLGLDPTTGEPNQFFAYLGKTIPATTDYIERAVLEDGTGSGMVGYYTQTVQKAIDSHWVTTSSRGISASDTTTDNTSALQALIDSNINVLIDTPVNLTKPINITTPHQIIRGVGKGIVRTYSTSMQESAMFYVKAEFVRIEQLTFDNVNSLKTQTGGRQGAIEINKNYCIVEGCTFWRCLNAVRSDASNGAYGVKILNNYFMECLGAGDGPNNTSSIRGEDRGDAVTIWGSGTVIANNHAYCKAGEDARIAFHSENLVPSPNKPNPEFDHKDIIMVGNMAYGSFRRHFVLENISNSLCIGNVSMGGATWWGEAYVNCTNVIAENVIRFTRVSTDQTGGYWSPNCACTALVNSSQGVTIRSTGYIDENGAGGGFVIQTVKAGTHRYTVEGARYINMNTGTSPTAFSVLTSEKGFFINCYAEGFSRQVFVNNSTDGFVSIQGGMFKGLGGGTGVSATVGSGGRIHVDSATFLNVISVAAIANADEVIVTNVKGLIDDGGYFVNNNGIKKMLRISGCTSLDKNTAIRHNTATVGTIPEINWHISDNMNITSSFMYSEAQLQDSTKMVNKIDKQIGKIVVVTPGSTTPSGSTTRNVYVSLGTQPTSGWRSMNSATVDGNGNVLFTTITPAAPTTT